MKLECLTEKLKAAVFVAERATGKNLSLPALSNIHLAASDRALKLEATNLELGVGVTIPARPASLGGVMVSGALLANFLSNLPASEEKIKLEVTSGNLHLETGSQSTTINGFPIDDFPSIPPIEAVGTFTAIPGALAEAFRSVGPSASNSNLKPEINSVCLYNQKNGLYAVATDSYRLAEKLLRLTGDLPAEFGHLILPLKSALEISRILENWSADKPEVEVRYNDHQISFSADNLYITSRLVDGTFPNYRQIMADRYQTEVTIRRSELVGRLKLLMVFSDKFNQADFTVRTSKEQLEIHTESEKGRTTAQLKLISSTGPDVGVGLNLRYLLEGLTAINDENIVLGLNEANKPIIMRGAISNEFLYLIMPIRR